MATNQNMFLLTFCFQSCEICQEPFETYWVEEEEDWFLKNAVRVDDKVQHAADCSLH